MISGPTERRATRRAARPYARPGCDLWAHAGELADLQHVEQGRTDVPLDAGAGRVLRLEAADVFDLEAAGRAEAGERAFAELHGVDGRAVGARADGLGVGDVVGDAD